MQQRCLARCGLFMWGDVAPLHAQTTRLNLKSGLSLCENNTSKDNLENDWVLSLHNVTNHSTRCVSFMTKRALVHIFVFSLHQETHYLWAVEGGWMAVLPHESVSCAQMLQVAPPGGTCQHASTDQLVSLPGPLPRSLPALTSPANIWNNNEINWIDFTTHLAFSSRI